MKPLEALKRIRQETCPATIIPDFDKEECCKVIEKELKAFEILKRTGLDIEWFKSYFIEQDKDFEVYDKVRIKFLGKKFTLAPSEFELLKEVLK